MGNLVTDLSVGRELIETHISWIFLGENDVYKVKKPVDLSFLDFTKLSERKRLCEVEVQLNQRLSHGVYLGVVPVVLTRAGTHQLGSIVGEVVDYAVHMRRLSADVRFDHLLTQGELSRTLVQQFAAHLAHFHAGCSTDPGLEQLGAPEAIRRNVDENFAQLGISVYTHLPRAQAVALPLMQRDFLEQHSSLFARRVLEGKVRDGHGDLRLEHVYAEPSGIQVLDCIEFNDRFRYADVCADLAFITMDLRHNGRPDLAEALVAAYAATTCDYELFANLNFYESYRAVVRAKVSHLALANHSNVAHRLDAGLEIRRYLIQAFDVLRGQERTPRIVAVGGLIASGKSHTAAEASGLLNCPVISTDRLRKHLYRIDPTKPLGNETFGGAYSEAATERTYALLLDSALHVLQSGRSVILDGTFKSSAERERVRDFCEANGTPFYFVECAADEGTLRRRLAQREQQSNVSDARESLLDDFMRRYQTPSEAEVGKLCRLNTTLPDAQKSQILKQFLNT
jgi:uncharacterized protein